MQKVYNPVIGYFSTLQIGEEEINFAVIVFLYNFILEEII